MTIREIGEKCMGGIITSVENGIVTFVRNNITDTIEVSMKSKPTIDVVGGEICNLSGMGLVCKPPVASGYDKFFLGYVN